MKYVPIFYLLFFNLFSLIASRLAHVDKSHNLTTHPTPGIESRSRIEACDQ